MLRLIQILTHYCISINVVMLHTSMFVILPVFQLSPTPKFPTVTTASPGMKCGLLICAQEMNILKENFPLRQYIY